MSDGIRHNLRGPMTVLALGTLGIGILLQTGCQSPYYADKGAVLGGLTGAGVGAAIGDAKDNAAGGALIGSAVGALAGAAAGSGLDAVQARNDALIEAQLGRPVSGTATLDDVVAMSQAGLGDDVIIQHLRNHGVASPPTAHDLIVLNQQGVGDSVLRALQDAAQPEARMPTAAPTPAPVIVEEYYVPRPYPFIVFPQPCPPWHGPPRRIRHSGPRVSWGLSVRN
jgi:hypothetical protein